MMNLNVIEQFRPFNQSEFNQAKLVYYTSKYRNSRISSSSSSSGSTNISTTATRSRTRPIRTTTIVHLSHLRSRVKLVASNTPATTTTTTTTTHDTYKMALVETLEFNKDEYNPLKTKFYQSFLILLLFLIVASFIILVIVYLSMRERHELQEKKRSQHCHCKNKACRIKIIGFRASTHTVSEIKKLNGAKLLDKRNVDEQVSQESSEIQKFL